MKQILITGPLNDLDDVLRIAREKGRKLLKVDKVIVKPQVTELNGDYIVCVEEMCSKFSSVGERTNHED